MPEPGPATILRGVVTESAANTLTEATINAPVDPRQNVAMLIHKVWLEPTGMRNTIPALPAPDATSDTPFAVQVCLSTRNGLTILPNISDAGLIAKSVRAATVVLASAPADTGVGVGYAEYLHDQQFEYPGGLLVADSQLSLYVQGLAQDSVAQGRCVIYYELVQVSSQLFFAALSALETLA